MERHRTPCPSRHVDPHVLIRLKWVYPYLLMSVLFGDVVRRGRERAGLSQARVAQLIGKSASTVRAWEQGRTRPADAPSVSALAAVLGLDESELLDHAGFEPAPSPVPKSAREELSSLAAERTNVQAVQTPVLPPTPDGVIDGPSQPGPRHLDDRISQPATPGRAPRRKTLTDATGAATDQATPLVTPNKNPKVTTVARRPLVVAGQTNISYIEDAEQRDFYRRRAVATAIVLVFLGIVLWWSMGRTGGAVTDFIESFVDKLNL